MTGAEIVKRYQMMNDYAVGNVLNLLQECADWCWPTNDNVNRIHSQGQEKPAQRMIDACIEANQTFAAGFFSFMFPPNTLWGNFKHKDPDLMAKPAVRQYFEKVSREVRSVIIGSNFAQEEFQSLLSMGCFGTNCMIVEEDKKNIIRFKNYVIPKIRIDENYLGEVDTIAREYEWSARQAYQKFGEKKLKEKKLDTIISDAKEGRDTKHTFIHFVEPRMDFDTKKKDVKNKPFASYYVHKKSKEIVEESGYELNPYKVARFTTGNDEIYGRGPMSMCLATARRANSIYRTVIVSGEQHSNPQWLIPDDDSVQNISSRAGAMIKWRASNPAGKPERLSPNGDPRIAVELLDMHHKQIGAKFYNHLFRPLDDYRNMTAWEARERSTTDQMQLTPFTSRYIEEHVTPIMNHVYYILQKNKKLPPLPQELKDSPDYDIEYVGRLSLATKSFETQGAINTLRIFGELATQFPTFQTITDNINQNKLFRDVYYAESSSMNALEDDLDVLEKEEAREAKIAQQRQLEATPAMADAAQKLSGKVDPSSVIAQAQG